MRFQKVFLRCFARLSLQNFSGTFFVAERVREKFQASDSFGTKTSKVIRLVAAVFVFGSWSYNGVSVSAFVSESFCHFPCFLQARKRIGFQSGVVVQQANRIELFSVAKQTLDGQIVGGSESKILVARVYMNRRKFLVQVFYRAVGTSVVGNGDYEMFAVLELLGHVVQAVSGHFPPVERHKNDSGSHAAPPRERPSRSKICTNFFAEFFH